MALRDRHEPRRRPDRHPSPGDRVDVAGQLHDQLHRQQDLRYFRRIRTAQGPAKRVFHVAPNEEKTPAFDPGPGHPDPDQGYAQGEHDLRAEFRQCRARQQRGQSALLDALRLLDRPGGGFDGRFGIYGRQLHGRQRSQELHLFLSGRFGGGYSRIRLDDVQIPACGDRPCGNQRYFHRPEPQADSLPGLCLRR